MAKKQDSKQSERLKKMEASASEIRQKAVALENAIQENKKRKKMAEALQRAKAREAEKDRVFASPSNSDEAEMQLPPLVEQLGIAMSEQDIIERGTLLQKARLYYTLLDYDGYFGSSESDPDEVKASLAASIKSKDDLETLQRCAKEFVALRRYGQRLSYYFKRFQTSFSILARLVNLWDSYEREAHRLTNLYNAIRQRDKDTADWCNDILSSGNGIKWEGACLRFDDERGAFCADVELEGGLYSQIQQEAASATEALSDFKAYAVVVEDFLRDNMNPKSILHYMPIAIQMSIENAEEERYTRYLVKNLSFFRSELNYRRSKGETISPEEERRAVIPDFYEVEPTPEVNEDCIAGLLDYLE